MSFVGDLVSAASRTVGLGSLAEELCDRLHLPKWVGDAAALGVDACTSNWFAVAEDSFSLANDIPRPEPPAFSAPPRPAYGWNLSLELEIVKSLRA